MRFAKFIWDNIDNSGGDISLGKIYEVIQYNKAGDPVNDTISIIDDKGRIRTCYVRTSNDTFFIEADKEYRSEIINSILE